MNTLPKSLTIALLALSIFFSGVTVDVAGAQNTAAGTAASRRPADEPLSRFLRFGRLTVADGLSNDQIWGIAQDQQGFIWIAANDGLNRYDGSDVKVYRHDPDDPRSLGHSFIRTMIADQNGTIWAGTWGGGLNQYDPEKDAFIRYLHNPDDPHSLIGGNVDLIYEGRHGMLWIALEAV